ncbi:metallohydrolase [Providencia stuartii]|uniref:metallohydrolase n=1 Tax=Providencia stuartii TaxID=588 RepID=UPI002989ACE9|nr:metallohydrolase [Providencia stuartii]HEM8345859.1 metallohydrolase [Providencia stuartii]
MAAKITFFQVDNGDMTLIRLADTRGTSILVDVHIRLSADDSNDDTADVASALRSRLKYDEDERPFIDVFMLSHPDKDHCSGLQKHFWLGPPEDYPDDHLNRSEKRIIIRELWSSPLIFRRRSKNHTLCTDAQAFNKEARRRVKYWRENNNVSSGNRILIMGEDVNGKTDDLNEILIKAGDTFTRIDGQISNVFSARLLAPTLHEDDEELEEELSKNESSIVMKMQILSSAYSNNPMRFLMGGDAEVLIWERLWNQYENDSHVLEYDLLLAPHHCSWHSLSYHSWSQKGEKAEVCEAARHALGQACSGATIVSSSKQILDDEVDPPCIRAKREYNEILDNVDGWFSCTGDLKDKTILEFEVATDGKLIPAVVGGISAATSTAVAAAPRAGLSKKYND